VKALKKLPLCQRIIKEAHSILMEGVRGKTKAPGEYRKIPNWIGPSGCSIEEARFVPISSDKLPEAMSAWERYIHSDVPDRLVQLAVLHVEFEALHPFLDGNGRLGRMFVPLFLCNMKILRTPMFYISAYFEANRDAYYERLTAVSREGDWTGWAVFFLEAITRQAEENKKKATAILELYKSKKDKIAALTHSQYSIKTLDFLFTKPIFQTSMFVSEAGIPEATAKRILKVLRENKFFQVLEEGSGRRPAMMAFRKLLNIAEGADVF
jgi:Fic family protein